MIQRLRSLVLALLFSLLAVPGWAGSFSDFAELKLLDHTFENTAYTPAATVYLALATADPTDAGTGATIAEPTYTGYARKAITFGAAATRQVAQSGVVSFDQCTVGSATVTHWAVLDGATTGAGNMLAHGQLSASKSIVVGNTPSVASGQVTISVSAGYVSDYLANKWLDFMFRNQAFTQPSVNVALTTATVSDSSTCSTITEPSGNNYARVDFADWTAASSGALDNGSAITFPTPSGSWGTIVATATCDAGTVGNLLVYDNGITDQAVGADDTVRFPTGSFDVGLQ